MTTERAGLAGPALQGESSAALPPGRGKVESVLQAGPTGR